MTFLNPTQNEQGTDKMRLRYQKEPEMIQFAVQHIYTADRKKKPVASELLLRSLHGMSLDNVINKPAVLVDHLAALMEYKAKAINGLMSAYPTHQFFVNVSPNQAASPGFIDALCSFKEYAVPHSSIALEITEDWDSVNEADAIKNLIKARRDGFSLVIDDFGKGTTSISLLAKLRPSIVKLDMSIVHNAVQCKHHYHLLHAITRMLQDMNTQVLVEGVETADMLAATLAARCDYVQGYLFHRPSHVSFPAHA